MAFAVGDKAVHPAHGVGEITAIEERRLGAGIKNFYILKKYNFSDLYALYVGHLADRMANNRKFASGWGDVGGFSRAEVAKMQRQFEAEGHDVGGADGLVGFKTRTTIGRWQEKGRRKITCMPDTRMVRSIH